MVDSQNTRGRTHLDDSIERELCRLNALLYRLLVRNTLQTVAIHDATNDVNLVMTQMCNGGRRVSCKIDKRLFLEEVHVALGRPCELQRFSR